MSGAELAALLAAAVHAAALAALESGADLEAAVHRAAAKTLAQADGDHPTHHAEGAAVRRRRLEAEMLAQLEELERTKGCNAARILAGRLACDPHDPREVERIAQNLRRLRRKTRTCSFSGEKAE